MFKKSVSLAVLLCFCLMSAVFVPVASADTAATLEAARGLCKAEGFTAFVNGIMEDKVIAGPDFDVVAKQVSDLTGTAVAEVKADMKAALSNDTLLADWEIPDESYDDFYPTVYGQLPNVKDGADFNAPATISVKLDENASGNVGEGLLYAAVKNAKFAGNEVTSSSMITVKLTGAEKFVVKFDNADAKKVADLGVKTILVEGTDSKAEFSASALAESGKTDLKVEKLTGSAIPEAIKTAVGSRPVFKVTSGTSAFAAGALKVTVPTTDSSFEESLSKAYMIETDGTVYAVENSTVNNKTAKFPVTVTGYFTFTDAAGLDKTPTPPDKPKDPSYTWGGGGSGSKPAIPTDSDFDDLPKTHWSYNYVMPLVKDEVLAGIGNNLFNPDGNVTREQFAKMIVVTFGMSLNGGNGGFTDVPMDAWYATYIQTAKDAGVVKGISDTEFGVGQNITRQDMATMLSRALAAMGKKLPSRAPAGAFSDQDQIADYALNAVMEMQVGGVIKGRAAGYFAPREFATRSEAAKMIYVIYYDRAE